MLNSQKNSALNFVETIGSDILSPSNEWRSRDSDTRTVMTVPETVMGSAPFLDSKRLRPG